jgi:amidohydrolase
VSTADELKQRACAAIDAHRDVIIALGEKIRVHPELGFKEFKTAAWVAESLTQLGVTPQIDLAITGVKGKLLGKNPQACVAYVGELDSILVSNHPEADPVTGAAHACGHNAQIANLVGVAYGLVEGHVMADLDGDVVLLAAPAEEYVELEYRLALKAEGKLEFLGGKQELLRLGAFDDVQILLATHQTSRKEPGLITNGGPSNGCLAKQIRFLGRSAHAGGAPHEGINALKAAQLALTAIDTNRETFQDKDHIRVHPIITKGGELVNVVPADVRLETYVRGASTEAMIAANQVVDRCLEAGAMALGAKVQINTRAGYLPKIIDCTLGDLYRLNAIALLGETAWFESEFSGGSTDIGDVSHVMPALEAACVGCTGTGHGADFRISDYDLAYIIPAKVAVMTIIDLLCNDADQARSILAAYKPAMTLSQYLCFIRSLNNQTTGNFMDAKCK